MIEPVGSRIVHGNILRFVNSLCDCKLLKKTKENKLLFQALLVDLFYIRRAELSNTMEQCKQCRHIIFYLRLLEILALVGNFERKTSSQGGEL